MVMVVIAGILGNNIAIGPDRLEHIARHGINWAIEDIVRIDDEVTKGKEGMHAIPISEDNVLVYVIRGLLNYNGNIFGIFRTAYYASPENVGSRDLPVFWYNK